MSEFEYLAVFVSIIFGISVTHVLAGVIRSFYRGQRDETHFVLSAFLFLVLILDWWTGIQWRDQSRINTRKRNADRTKCVSSLCPL